MSKKRITSSLIVRFSMSALIFLLICIKQFPKAGPAYPLLMKNNLLLTLFALVGTSDNVF